MIESLHIENVAVVKCLDVELGKGLTALSGETGAGKSIIIDSLGLLLGAKADRELIRTGEDRAEVSALFGNLSQGTRDTLGELGIECEDGCVVLSRVLTHSSSSARINGRAVTVAMLRDVGRTLINIHGQNDNQQLLDQKNHVRLLDTYADSGALLEEYKVHYRRVLELECRIDSVKKDAMESLRISEMLRFHVADIDGVKPKVDEEEALEELVRKLSAAEKISKSASLVDKAIRGGEKGMGAAYLTDRAATALEAIADAVPEAGEIAQRLNNIRYELEDIAECVRDACEVGDNDPTARLDKAQSRLAAISKLKRKYGSTVEEILEYRNASVRRLEDLERSDELREDLEAELAEVEAQARAVAERLREKRRAAAERLDRQVCDTLSFLDMPKVRFKVGVTPVSELGAFGCDRVEFLIATNAGEPLQPMARIASGGELARIMLSLKNVLNECDGVGTVVFDEIDTGISGKTSRKVGIKLKEIGEGAQVLCVTHSAQIASLAHNHLKISKSEQDGRVSTSVRLLDREGRIEEISRILGGIEITDTVRRAAVEMITEGENYR